MVKSHQIKLYPTKSQKVLLVKSCGVARFSYNWALNKWIEDYKVGIKSSAYTLVKHLNSIKKEQFPWMQETSKNCSQYAIHNLESAFKKMWKEKSGYPKFKKRGGRDSFVAVENNESFKQKDFKIHTPRIGKIKCSENLRFIGKVNNVTVKRIADMWFAVININVEDIPINKHAISENQAVVGVDIGIKSMLVLSDGTIYENPKALKGNLKSIKRLQRGLSRKIKGSNNRKKQVIRVAKKHYKITCLRKNAIHLATSQIVNNYDKIVIETLKPQIMVKNRRLSQAINDVSFGEISRQLVYKSRWMGKELVKADQWFPSSKTCSDCGHKKVVLKLHERIFNCESCGFVKDRDLNAAINLANYSPTLKFKGSEACGVPNSSLETKSRGTKKQEIDLVQKINL